MIITKLKEDLKQAMKDKNTINKSVLQVLISSINSFEKTNKKISEDDEITLINRELKQTRESFVFAEKSGREDLINETKTKIDLLVSYLPIQMNEEEINSIIKDAILELNVENISKNDKGKIMKIIMSKLKGKAEGKTIDVESFFESPRKYKPLTQESGAVKVA